MTQRETNGDHTAHGMAQQMTAFYVERAEKACEILRQNVERIRVDVAEVRRFAMAALVRYEHAMCLGEPLQLIVEVELRSGEPVHQHERFTPAFVVIGSENVAVANEMRCKHV